MEAWTRDEKPNLSWSHPWATAPATAIARGFMGIVPTAPAYQRFDVKPQPGNVSAAEITLPTLSGAIWVSFKQVPGLSFLLAIRPPPNTLSRVCLPRLGLASSALVLDGNQVAGVEQGDYVCVGGIGSTGGAARQISRARGVVLS